MEVISWKAASWLSWQPFEPCSLILLPPPSWTNAPRGPMHLVDQITNVIWRKKQNHRSKKKKKKEKKTWSPEIVKMNYKEFVTSRKQDWCPYEWD